MIWLYRGGGAETPPEDLSQEVLSGFMSRAGALRTWVRTRGEKGESGLPLGGNSGLLRVVVVLRYKDYLDSVAG